jgi:hypothetical protein
LKTSPIPPPENWQELKPHPLSDLVEFGAGISIEALAEHMRQHGYDEDEAIVLHEGMILDGRHRHQGAIEAGVTPTFRAFAGRNAMAYVAKKLHRQHLNESQRALMAATLAKMSPLAGVQICTLQGAANTMNVSRRSVASAAKILKEGTPELAEAVRQGEIAVDDAAKIVSQPPEAQIRAVEEVRAGHAKTASAALESLKEEETELRFPWEGIEAVERDIPIGSILFFAPFLFRGEIDQGTVEAYAESMRAGCIFPPIVVFQEKHHFWLAEGVYRIKATLLTGAEAIRAAVRPGTERDARFWAAGANAEHLALPRNIADMRHQVRGALTNFPEKSDEEIAQHVGVTVGMVSRLRQQINSERGGD